jgi:iron complex outermembrane receptor protein
MSVRKPGHTDATVVDFPDGPRNNNPPATAAPPLQPVDYVATPAAGFFPPRALI